MRLFLVTRLGHRDGRVTIARAQHALTKGTERTQLRHGLGMAMLLAMMGTPAAAQVRRALLVGINDYESAGPPVRPPATASGTFAGLVRGRIGNLDGAINDVMSIRETLSHRFQFADSDIRVLVDAQATRAGILSAIDSLTTLAQRGDLVVFFYAGHGAKRVNSLSHKLTKLDQTIVPSDANAGVFDVRDKELATAFDRVLAKGAILTLIFDACYSGSITRGGLASGMRERWAFQDPRDAADPVEPLPPQDGGALVLSAARDDQVAYEEPDRGGADHGVFTSALIAAIEGESADAPAGELFRRLKARMQSLYPSQEPVIDGRPERLRRTLFGDTAGKGAGRIVAAVVRIDRGQVELQAGRAAGIGVGSELARVNADSQLPVRLRVGQLMGVDRSEGVVIDGRLESVHPGDLFAVDNWIAPGTENVRVWIPPSVREDSLALIERELTTLRASGDVRWVDDPTTVAGGRGGLFVAFPGSDGWELQMPLGRIAKLGPLPTAKAVKDALRSTGSSKPLFFAVLPPPPTVVRGLSLGTGSSYDAIGVATDREHAHYLLVGRLAQEGVEYAWVMPNATLVGGPRTSLPLRTDWLARPSPAADAKLADSLQSLAATIGRIRAWLALESPPGDAFPYHLTFVTDAGERRSTGPFVEGDTLAVVLRADTAALTRPLVRRRVYIFAISSDGSAVRVYPPNNAQNLLPLPTESGRFPAEIALGNDFRFSIRPPFGLDTYFFLTSDEEIPVDLLAWEGVRNDRTRGVGHSCGVGLVGLLCETGRPTRGLNKPAPASWSLERVPILSVAPKPAGAKTAPKAKPGDGS